MKSQYDIAMMYYVGEGSAKQDFIEAFQWFHKSAEQGLPEAQYKVAQMYQRGEGVSQDFAKAALWYKRYTENTRDIVK